MTLGSILMCFLNKRDDDGRDRGTPKSSTFLDSVVSLWDLVVAPLLDKRMLLIIPLIVYSGLQQAFVWAEFTKEIVKPALGVSGVGGSMAVYGVFDAISSLVSGTITSGLSSITLITPSGAFVQLVVLLWILLGYRHAGCWRRNIQYTAECIAWNPFQKMTRKVHLHNSRYGRVHQLQSCSSCIHTSHCRQ
ncbi:hypothetical protein MKX01_031461 [Papaver californicum]|nr:hypothetical protein MKX01_031461 [Papaver californicum]